MGTMASQITSLTIIYSTVIQAQIKENIGDRWTPRTRASNVENVSIWWRRHVIRHNEPTVDNQTDDVHTPTLFDFNC